MTAPVPTVEFTAPCPVCGGDCTWRSVPTPLTDKEASPYVIVCGRCWRARVWTVAAQTQRHTALAAAVGACDITSRRTA